jgi:hypothetical protein
MFVLVAIVTIQCYTLISGFGLRCGRYELEGLEPLGDRAGGVQSRRGQRKAAANVLLARDVGTLLLACGDPWTPLACAP